MLFFTCFHFHRLATYSQLVLLFVKVSFMIDFQLEKTSFGKYKIILYSSLIFAVDQCVNLSLRLIGLGHPNYGVNLVICDDNLVADLASTFLVAQSLSLLYEAFLHYSIGMVGALRARRITVFCILIARLFDIAIFEAFLAEPVFWDCDTRCQLLKDHLGHVILLLIIRVLIVLLRSVRV